MILVSFSSAEDALSNDVKKKKEIFSSQGTENPPFRFFGDTRYRVDCKIYMHHARALCTEQSNTYNQLQLFVT